MEQALQSNRQIHSPLYDRRLMILILKKYNGRRSFSENCRLSKIKEERRYGQYESTKTLTKAQTENQRNQETQETYDSFRSSDSILTNE